MTNTTNAPAPCETRCALTSGCEPCLMAVLATVNAPLVDLWATHGRITVDARDAYRHVWAISHDRGPEFAGYLQSPVTETGRRLASILVALLPGGRAYC